MKFPPSEICCRAVKHTGGAQVYLYRWKSEETDSLHKENDILHARGLWCEANRTEWIPRPFYFRKSKSHPAGLVTEDWMVQWLVAGIFLGESFNPHSRQQDAFDHREDVWRYWLHWQLGDKRTIFRNECAEHLKTTPAAVRQHVSHLGLSEKAIRN